VVSTPTRSRLVDSGNTPPAGNVPRSGIAPTTPQSAAGIRTEPAVSVPSATGATPAATAAAEPALEPPVMRLGSCGLRHGPATLDAPVQP
jgi:hypothetical protein